MPVTPTLTIHRLAPGLDRAAWLRELSALEVARCEVLKRDGDELVVGSTIDRRPVVVKASVRHGVIRGLRAWLGLSRDDRQWRGAMLLREAGVPSAAPLALATRLVAGAPAEGLLVLERLAGPTLLETLSRGGLSVQQEHALAREAGRIAGRIDLARMSNRDAKPSNWIVMSADACRPVLAMIDTAGVRRGQNLAWMLASMLIESIGTGCPPRRTLAMRCLDAVVAIVGNPASETRRRVRRKKLWVEVAALVRAHEDPIPRVNPLGPARSD